LLTNLHPFDQQAIPAFEAQYPGALFFLRPGTDLYPVLRFANALVTDYSSLMFDYLVLDRPIILYRPDHERFQAQSRALFDKKIALPPGPICHTATELSGALENVLNGADPAAANRRALRETWFDHVDGNSAARVTKMIMEML
jgi:CDP-glycerol glycerophosphotransferase